MAETFTFSDELSKDEGRDIINATALLVAHGILPSFKGNAGEGYVFRASGLMRRLPLTQRGLKDPLLDPDLVSHSDENQIVDEVIVRNMDEREAGALGLLPGVRVVFTWTDPREGSVVYTANPGYAAFQIEAAKVQSDTAVA